MISINHLTIEFSSKPILQDISFLINRRDKIALVGKNGAGKSTLLKTLAGLQQPTHGSIAMPSELTIGYLPQQMIHNDGTTVVQETRKAFNHITQIQQRIQHLTEQLTTRQDYDSPQYQELIDQLEHDNQLLSVLDANKFEGEIEKTLLGLGFERKDFDRQCSEFSGGWRMRIELAKILLQQPDLMLLDEPTNHLDIESIQWLEQFLKTTNNAVLLVSHDRTFLDNVTNRTIEITLGQINDYNTNYTHYLELRKERYEQQLRAYENQQKMIQETEDFIERFRYKATKAVQVQSRIKQLNKLERIEIEPQDTAHIHLRFPPAPRSGDYPIIADEVEKSFGDHTVFSNVNFVVKRGEKIAFVGKNGEGKTTLVRCIMNQISYNGTIKIGHNVKIGYFAQNQASLLDENLTVFETIDNEATGEIRTQIRNLLGAFMFGGEESEKKVKVLSGGERSRLAMIKLLLQPVNLLILDEPTNHLDIQTKEILKQALQQYDGTLIVVSHDRYFLDGLVNKVYEFGGGKVREHLGTIHEFLQKKNISNLQELERKETTKETTTKETQNKLNYQQQKQQQSNIRKIERQIKEIESQITELENKLKGLEAQMATPQGAANATLAQEYQSTMNLLNDKMFEWEELSNKM
ncbi:MAG: ABC-F family ATP-binding cassette domain-containing protein [Paludibacteraceae bacterium]|nr:ABC-F family ATP-binding cassette domain-containing protein [Paludibacteraceae bacterium]